MNMYVPRGISRLAHDPVSLHHSLSSFNARRLAPALPTPDWRYWHSLDSDMAVIEGEWLEEEREAQGERAAAAPSEPEGFLVWFEALKQTGPGQGDPLFDYLADRASFDEMRWFLAHEVSGEAGFDDLAAMTQVRLPVRPKLEVARNYWDEMGRGNAKGMHGPMLKVLADALDVHPLVDKDVWEAVALSNLMAGLAANRRYAFHSLGALGVIELTAPGRAAKVSLGLKRLGVAGKVRHYFDLHAVLDVKHSEAWNAEVLLPLVEARPETAAAMAEGALMRLQAGARCFHRYRTEFGLR
jgi:hypothetical protein